MTVEKITDHLERSLKRLISQYKDSPNIESILRVYGPEIQQLENMFSDIFTKTIFLQSEGEQLDRIGLILNQPRQGLSDLDYKTVLIGKIAEYNSEGTPEDLINIYSILTDAQQIQYEEIYPANFRLHATNANPIGTLLQVSKSLERAKPAGVGSSATVSTANPFVFEGDPDGNGFDDFLNPGAGGELSSII